MRILPSVAGLALVAILLTGCLPQQPTDQPTPLPSSTPVFASDEDALAAAEAAYARYVQITDQIFIDGGAGPERLNEVATGEQLKVEIEGFQEISAKGYHSTGGTVFESMEIQQLASDRRSTEAVLSVYVCEDISKVDVVDSTGVSIVSPTRPNRVRYQITFDLKSSSSDILLVSLKEPWEQGC